VEAIKWRTTTPAEQPRAFDLLAVVGQLARAGQGRVLRQALADLVIDVLQLGEESAGEAVRSRRGRPQNRTEAF
jgi:hypothetical protein